MKKTFIILAVLCCAFSAFCGGGKESVIETKPAEATAPAEVTVISTKTSPAAEVELIRKATFTREEIDAQLKVFKDAGQEVDEKAFIENVVVAELLNQAMERDNVDREKLFSDYVLEIVSYYAAQEGVEFNSQEDVEKYLAGKGTTLDDFASSLVNQFQNWLIGRYVTDKYKEELENIPTPDNNTIMAFFEQNKNLFVSSEKIKVAHIFFVYPEDGNKEALKAYADDVYAQIRDGKISFEDAVKQYSQDSLTVEKDGVLGWMDKKESAFELDLAQGVSTSDFNRELFTEETFNKLFEVSEGTVTGVLASQQGYHIFKVLNHMNEKLLALTDTVQPESDATVYDFCKSYIYQAYSENALNSCYAKLVEELRKEAKVTIY